MSSEQEMVPGWFTESPTVIVEVQEAGNPPRKFHLHKSVLEHQGGWIKKHLQHDKPGKSALSIHVSVTAFRDYISWLYGWKFRDTTPIDQIVRLCFLACKYRIVALQNAIVDWCRQYCSNETSLLRLLRQSASSSLSPEAPSPSYIIEKVAYEITMKGWIKVIEASDGEWERFISTRDSSSVIKGEYVSTLISKLEETEKLNAESKLTDPATSICKWHGHDSEGSSTAAGTMEACKACSPAD